MSNLFLCAFGFVIINPFVSKKTYKYYLWFILGVLVYFAYHIEVTEVMDLYKRVGEMELYREVGWNWVVINRMHENPLATMFFYLFAQFDDPMLLPAFTAFICYGVAFSILLKCAKRYELTKGQMNFLLLIFCLNFYFDQAISNVRIYLCYALISYFMYNEIIEGRFKKLSWIAYVACCFMHYAVVPFLLFRILLGVKRKFKNSELLLLAIVFLGILGGEFIIPKLSGLGGMFETLAFKNEEYQEYQVFGIWQFLSSLIRVIGFTGVYLYLYKKVGVEEKLIIFYLACVSMMILLMLGEYQLVLRTPNFIHFLGMIPISMLFKLGPASKRQDGMIRSALYLYIVMMTAFTIFYQVMFIYPSVGFEF